MKILKRQLHDPYWLKSAKQNQLTIKQTTILIRGKTIPHLGNGADVGFLSDIVAFAFSGLVGNLWWKMA